MNINKVILVGNLASDPEMRTAPSGQQVCSFRLATNRFWIDKTTGQKQSKVEFHSIVAWGKLADLVSRYLTKGSMAFIEGRLETRSWQDPSGVKRFRTEVIATNIQLGPRTAKQTQAEEQLEAEPPLTESPLIEEEGEEEGEEEIDVKDIPL
jgi:single-strand DNA-binding protein